MVLSEFFTSMEETPLNQAQNNSSSTENNTQQNKHWDWKHSHMHRFFWMRSIISVVLLLITFVAGYALGHLHGGNRGSKAMLHTRGGYYQNMGRNQGMRRMPNGFMRAPITPQQQQNPATSTPAQ